MLNNFHFHHIGIATKCLVTTSEFYIKAGYNHSDVYVDNIQGVKVLFLTKNNMPRIELVEPLTINSPVSSIIEKNGTTTYHICYEVDDIVDSISKLKTMKYIAISNPVPAIAFNYRKICFLYNKDIGLIELLEK